MRLSSDAWRSELELNRPEIEIEDFQSYIAVRSPRWPTHIWKNFVLFASNGGQASVEEWLAIHAACFPNGGAHSSTAVGWDIDFVEPIFDSALQDAGFVIEREVVLRAKEIRHSRHKEEIVVEPVSSDALWSEVIQRRIRLLAAGRNPDLQAQFEREKFEIYRSMAGEGDGAWFVARQGCVPVADMGLFVTPERIGRFQEVLVYPGFRGQGIGRAMAGEASRQIRTCHGVSYFVTVTQTKSIAERTYCSIGFEHCGIQARAVRIAL